MTKSVEVPASVSSGTQTFELPNFFQVIDDDIDEIDQSFAIVAELGPDVSDTPFNFSCFQTHITRGTQCFGRHGATDIIVYDNDRKLRIKPTFFMTYSFQYLSLLHFPVYSNDRWLH